MPYIPMSNRSSAENYPTTPGELNFAITRLMSDYISNKGSPTYNSINDCLGACEGAKMELYRRVAIPYEDRRERRRVSHFSNRRMMMTKHIKKTVYLAGPITGLTHDQARYGWRQKFDYLMPAHILCASPMRGKEFLQDHGILSSGDDYPDHAMATSEGITTRDYNDVKTSDAMVTCYTESNNTPSLGTAVEYGYAWSHQVPIIAVGPADEVNIRHLMLKRMMAYRVDTIEEAAVIVTHLLTPGI